jgi:uncharacterized membrane protein
MADEILPSSDVLQQYETIYKGSAKKTIDAFVQESDHRRALERRALEGQIEYTRRGQLFGLIIGLCAIVAGATTAALGAEWSGAVIGGGGVIGLVSVFVMGHRRAWVAQPNVTPSVRPTLE